VRVLTELAGLRVPDEDYPHLRLAVEQYLGAVRALAGLDLTWTDPAVTFDARWD